MSTFRVSVSKDYLVFASAHFITFRGHQCETLHGHNYRLGIAVGDEPERVEAQLCRAMPKPRWTRTSDTLILHGRRICRPKPLCDRCAARELCRYYRSLGPAARKGGGSPRSAPKRLPKGPAAPPEKTARSIRTSEPQARGRARR